MNLFEEFNSSTKEEWLEKIEKDLKGNPLSSLAWNSSIGTIDPVIFENETLRSNPSNSPFTRSTKTSNSWNIAQHVNAADKEANKHVLNALKGGANYLIISNLSSSIDLNKLFQDVELEIIHTGIILTNDTAIDVLDFFLSFINKDVPFTIFFDPIGEMIQSGNQKEYKDTFKQVLEILSAYPNAKINPVNGSIYSDSGANEDKQISLTAAHLNEYLNIANENGFISQLKDRLVITSGVGTTYFLEIAKVRALRKVLTTVLNEYNLTSTELFAETSSMYFSKMDSYSNLLRATTQAMSAVIGGYDTVLVFPYHLKSDDPFGNRIAQNIQLVLQEEGLLNKVVDPAGGAYFIEEITDQLIDKSWTYFQEIERNGGLIQGIKNNTLQTTIEKDWNERLEQLKKDEKVMIGVNKFINNLEDFTPIESHSSNTPQTEFTPLTKKRLAEFFENNTVENA